MNAKLLSVITASLRKNPKLSFVFVALGLWMISYGYSKGEFFGPMLDQKSITMTVTETYNRNGRTAFPDFAAKGHVTQGLYSIDVAIFRRQYESLKPGDNIEVYKVPGESKYIFQGKLEEASPIFNLYGFWFSWYALAGLIIMSFCPLLYIDAAWYKKKMHKS